MDKEILVNTDIDAGSNVIEALHDANFPINSAMWVFMPEYDEYRFVVASPYFDERGQQAAYKRILAILRKMPTEKKFPSTKLMAVSPKHPLIQNLGSATQNLNGKSGIRFTRSRVKNLFVDDAFVYRIP